MPDFMRLFNKYKEKWNGFDKSQKLRLILSAVIVLGSVASAYLFVKSEVFRNTVTLVSALIMGTFLIGGVVEILLYFDNVFVALLVSIGFLWFCIKGLCHKG